MANEDPAYLEWIRGAPCAVCSAPPRSHAHHHTHGASTPDGARARGKGQKAHDWFTMPLCYLCHDNFHRASGRFKTWTKAQRVEWQDALVARLRAAYVDTSVF